MTTKVTLVEYTDEENYYRSNYDNDEELIVHARHPNMTMQEATEIMKTLYPDEGGDEYKSELLKYYSEMMILPADTTIQTYEEWPTTFVYNSKLKTPIACNFGSLTCMVTDISVTNSFNYIGTINYHDAIIPIEFGTDLEEYRPPSHITLDKKIIVETTDPLAELEYLRTFTNQNLRGHKETLCTFANSTWPSTPLACLKYHLEKYIREKESIQMTIKLDWSQYGYAFFTNKHRVEFPQDFELPLNNGAWILRNVTLTGECVKGQAQLYGHTFAVELNNDTITITLQGDLPKHKFQYLVKAFGGFQDTTLLRIFEPERDSGFYAHCEINVNGHDISCATPLTTYVQSAQTIRMQNHVLPIQVNYRSGQTCYLSVEYNFNLYQGKEAGKFSLYSATTSPSQLGNLLDKLHLEMIDDDKEIQKLKEFVIDTNNYTIMAKGVLSTGVEFVLKANYTTNSGTFEVEKKVTKLKFIKGEKSIPNMWTEKYSDVTVKFY
jgi:hypothetical protein